MLGISIVCSRQSSLKVLAVEGVSLSRLLSMEVIRLDRHAAQVKLTKQLCDHGPLVVLFCGVADLPVTARLLRSKTPSPVLLNTARHGANNAELPQADCIIEPRTHLQTLIKLIKIRCDSRHLG